MRSVPNLRMTFIALVSSLLSTMGVGRVLGQSTASVFIDARVGFAHVASGEQFKQSNGYAIGVIAGLPLARRESGAITAAVGASRVGKVGSNDSCLLDTNGFCLPELPDYTVLSLMAGWRTRSGSLQALAGPAIAYFGRARKPAAQLELTAATPSVGHAALLVSGTGIWIRSQFRPGGTTGLLGLGVGLRLQ